MEAAGEDTGLSKDLLGFLASMEEQQRNGGAGQGAGAPLMPAPPPQQQQPTPSQHSPAEMKTWTTLYTCYFDPAITMAMGRRLPISKLVGCDEPWPHDIGYACAALGFPKVVLESKRHPTYKITQAIQQPPLRVRVMLKHPDGRLVIPRIATKQALLYEIAKLLPILPVRLQRIQEVSNARLQFAAQQAQQAKAKAAAGPAKKVDKPDPKKGKGKK